MSSHAALSSCDLARNLSSRVHLVVTGRRGLHVRAHFMGAPGGVAAARRRILFGAAAVPLVRLGVETLRELRPGVETGEKSNGSVFSFLGDQFSPSRKEEEDRLTKELFGSLVQETSLNGVTGVSIMQVVPMFQSMQH
eukprot:gb/GEZN01013260.1/.p2 GENE.gb/GEZN01013260.1/~~gb/GEZN01013260.1/.p2  ORF type:complete len:138 (-),score=18.51 gb/GEZN01013260.1/:143-556(-)